MLSGGNCNFGPRFMLRIDRLTRNIIALDAITAGDTLKEGHTTAVDPCNSRCRLVHRMRSLETVRGEWGIKRAPPPA